MKTASLFLFIFFATNDSLVAQVAPFLTTTWNQTCFYNDSCPTVSSGGSCGKAYTGCNATALGQICKYYAYPTTGLSNHCNANLPTQCVDFSTQTYNYTAMPNNVTSTNVEVAKLLGNLGAACDMQYSGTSSNSYFDANVLKRYYAYSPRLYSSATFLFNTTQELIDAIKLELDAGRPVFAKGGNHFYLIDGYDASDNFHMNFGWSGTYNGYYAINNVVNGAGTFTPSNFMFMIRPLDGDLETSNDTIVVSAAAGPTSFEFTSLLNWTITTPTSWLTTALSAGSPGYYAFSDGNTFTTLQNNGGVRYGYIYVQNANNVDTIVVQQDASPLGVTPDSLFYAETGGSQNASIVWYSWSTWSATSPDTWISITPASGTGNGTPTITCALNSIAAPRMGYVAVNGGTYRDTIWIFQDGSTLGFSAIQSNPQVTLFPNPASDHITIVGLPPDELYTITIYNALGQIILVQGGIASGSQLDVRSICEGRYVVLMQSDAGITRYSSFCK